jgi:hypothetical protein
MLLYDFRFGNLAIWLVLSLNKMQSTPKSIRPSTAGNVRKNVKFVASNITSGHDARLLLPGARTIRDNIHLDEITSKKLLRDIYSAETNHDNPTVDQVILNYMLRLRSDIRVLKVFATKEFDTTLQLNDTVISRLICGNNVEALCNDSANQMKYLFALLDMRDSLMLDLCSTAVDKCTISSETQNMEPLPNLCTDKLMSLFNLCKFTVETNQVCKNLLN